MKYKDKCEGCGKELIGTDEWTPILCNECFEKGVTKAHPEFK